MNAPITSPVPSSNLPISLFHSLASVAVVPDCAAGLRKRGDGSCGERHGGVDLGDEIRHALAPAYPPTARFVSSVGLALRTLEERAVEDLPESHRERTCPRDLRLLPLSRGEGVSRLRRDATRRHEFAKLLGDVAERVALRAREWEAVERID